jgi:hypothetical protein
MDKADIFSAVLWKIADDDSLHIWGMLTERSQRAIVGELTDRFLAMPAEEDGRRFYWLYFNNVMGYNQAAPVQTLSLFDKIVREAIVHSFLKSIPATQVRI